MKKWRKWIYLYSEVAWGIDGCLGADNCMNRAECLFDGQPLCIDCADLLLERTVAITEVPRLRNELPPLWESTPTATTKRQYDTMQ